MIYLNGKFSHIILCNLLTTILKPTFHKPIDSARDLVDQNITLFTWPGGHIWKQFLISSPIAEYQILGESLFVADNYSHYDNLTAKEILEYGTHGRMTAFLSSAHLRLGKWYRSDEVVGGRSSDVGYLTSKNWNLNEELKIEFIEICSNLNI